MKLKVESEVSKEAHELALAVCNVVRAVKAAMADGFQAGTDLPLIITAAITQLPPAIEGLDKIIDEAKESPLALAKAVSLPVLDLVEDLLKKDEVVA